MDKIEFTCPGKIFIIGEYSCLTNNSPAILTTIQPRFKLIAHKRKRKKQKTDIPFHPKSPAGIFLKKNDSLLESIDITWKDPYRYSIGVGASSAQFLLSVALIEKLKEKKRIKNESLLKKFWDTFETTKGLKPSGADILIQHLGELQLIQPKPYKHEKLPLLDKRFKFVLAYTGKKTKTHEHLAELRDQGFPTKFNTLVRSLRSTTVKASTAWKSQDGVAFGKLMNTFQGYLNTTPFVPKAYAERITKIQKWPGVLGCKGSGAQGGDCILLLIEQKLENNIFRSLEESGLKPINARWILEGLKDIIT